MQPPPVVDPLVTRDLNVVWHPCTQMKDHEQIPLIALKSGKGVWLEDFSGHRYLDAISSWWVNLFGHSNPYINQQIAAQCETLEHAMLAGFTHEPVVRLAERLVELTPTALTRCFFADNGSSAVEVALKMSFQAWRNQGITSKTKFVALKNSYHGETLAALAVSDVDLYKKTYQPLLMEAIHVESPDCFYAESSDHWREYTEQQFEHMRLTLERDHQSICAVIIEPLVQCAGSMRMYHPVYLQKLRALCDAYQVYLIADEIAVGFGRTGTMFACEQANIAPDFMCLSKGITGGYLPLSVVLTRESIYQQFYHDYVSLKGFLHSHSYTGNPIACAAANATLDLFEQHDVIRSNQSKSAKLAQLLQPFKQHPYIGDVRQTGMIAAIEMTQKHSKQAFPWQKRLGLQVYQHALSKGVLLRPLGHVIYFMPPYVITDAELELMVAVAWESIEVVVGGLD